MDKKELTRRCILGHNTGDALGLPHQFQPRTHFDAHPVTDMTGHGVFDKPAGYWSDDSSMTLAALDALAEGPEKDRVMNNLVKWLYRNEYTPNCPAYDIGGTCESAVTRYVRTGDAEHCGDTDERCNGNGSLMRILPAVLYAAWRMPDADTDARVRFVEGQSALTHAHPRSCFACGIYAFMIWEMLQEQSKQAALRGIAKAKEYYEGRADFAAEADWFRVVFNPRVDCLPRENVESDGYVVDSLEAAVWCLLNTENYRDCTLLAVNLGEDTDTTAAIAGGVAGLLYGVEGIPTGWLEKLARREWIEGLCDRFAENLTFFRTDGKK